MTGTLVKAACSHSYAPSGVEGYEVCACGTYHSTLAPPPEEVYTPEYWSHARGHSTIHEQVYNVSEHQEGGKTKYEFLLERIKVEPRSSALEIGCAPGRLLLLLRGMAGFDRVVGIEGCREYERDIREIGCHGGELLFGFFPECADGLASESFDLITALDVFEHSPTPELFLQESARLLRPTGQLLLMLPLASDRLPERFYEPREHVYIHTLQNVIAMLWDAGLAFEGCSEWCAGHDLIEARRLA